MRFYTLTGSGGCGKSSFAQRVCQLVYPYGFELSTIDLIKDLARQAGWDGKKTPQARKGLSDLKDILTVWLDAPVKDIDKTIRLTIDDFESRGADVDNLVFFINVREPYEIARLAEIYNAKTIRVLRDEADNAIASNHADADVKYFNYDIYIDNNGTLEDLAYKALEFVQDEKLALRQGAFKFDEEWNFCYNIGEDK